MKPIEKLADEHFNTLPVNGSHIWMFNSSELEAICKAYMQDRLSELEPVAFITLVDDEELLSTNEAMAYGHGKNAEVTELHDISLLKDKP